MNTNCISTYSHNSSINKSSYDIQINTEKSSPSIKSQYVQQQGQSQEMKYQLTSSVKLEDLDFKKSWCEFSYKTGLEEIPYKNDSLLTKRNFDVPSFTSQTSIHSSSNKVRKFIKQEHNINQNQINTLNFIEKCHNQATESQQIKSDLKNNNKPILN